VRILIVGSGDIGAAIALKFHTQGHYVVALRRSKHTQTNGLSYIQSDISDDKSIENLDTEYDFVLFIASVDSSKEEAYISLYRRGLNNLLKLFKQNNSQASFVFVSSTAVYGQSSGEYVDENTPTVVNSFRSQILLEAENSILSHNNLSLVVRFSGIYGRGDKYMIEKITKKQAFQYTPIHYTNRIHRDDCIGIICFFIEKKKFNELVYRIYNATQDNAISFYDYALIIAKENDLIEPVKEIVDLKEVAQGKRISNKRVRELGYKFQHNFS